MAASGLQIAVLIALFEISFAIVTYYVERAIGWPLEHSKVLGNFLSSFAVLLLFLAVAPLRQYLRRELARPLRLTMASEVALVAVAKAAIPFAFMAATFLYLTATSGTPDEFAHLASNNPEEAARRYYTGIGLFYGIAIAMIIGPFIEEIVFRGFLYGAWERQWGWFPAMLATSVCFGLIHPGKFMLTFVGSIVFVCVLRRTGTLWGPILAHMIFNALVTLPLLGQFFMTKRVLDIRSPSEWAVEIACLVFIGVALPTYVWLARTKRAPENP